MRIEEVFLKDVFGNFTSLQPFSTFHFWRHISFQRNIVALKPEIRANKIPGKIV